MDPENPSKPFKVLFVCLGNICRSPAAEIILHSLISQSNCRPIFVDSAGTESEHPNSPPDKRMSRALARRGYKDCGHRARRITVPDLESFDLIVTMDRDNYMQVKRLDRNNLFQDKIVPMNRFVKKYHVSEIPDPWYGGASDFEYVIDLLEDGCGHLLNDI